MFEFGTQKASKGLFGLLNIKDGTPTGNQVVPAKVLNGTTINQAVPQTASPVADNSEVGEVKIIISTKIEVRGKVVMSFIFNDAVIDVISVMHRLGLRKMSHSLNNTPKSVVHCGSSSYLSTSIILRIAVFASRRSMLSDGPFVARKNDTLSVKVMIWV
jgi:hypothetical protein